MTLNHENNIRNGLSCQNYTKKGIALALALGWFYRFSRFNGGHLGFSDFYGSEFDRLSFGHSLYLVG